jgi:hypothetical protein
MNLTALLIVASATAAAPFTLPTEPVREVDRVLVHMQPTSVVWPSAVEAPALDQFDRALFWTNDWDEENARYVQALHFGSSASAMEVVAQTGMDAPGLPVGVEFTQFTTFSPLITNSNPLSRTGLTAIRAAVAGSALPNGTTEGIWATKNSGSLELVALNGQHAVGAPPAVKFAGFDTPLMDGLGRAVFIGMLEGPGVGAQNDVGLWRASLAGGIESIAIEGQQVPELPLGTNFSLIRGNISATNAGQAGFYGGYRNASGEFKPAIWRAEADGRLELIAAKGDAAAGLPAGYRFSEFSSPRLAASGEALFEAFVETPDGSTSNRGLWFQANEEQPSLVAFEGHPVPGGDGSVIFDEIVLAAVPSSSGRVAFQAFLRTPDRLTQLGSSVWGGHYTDLKLIAKAGDKSPGFGETSTFDWVGPPIQNAVGDVVFMGGAMAADSLGLPVFGIWHHDRYGELELVVAAEQLLDVAAGSELDLRRISDLQIAEGSLNDHGVLTFAAKFIDGSEGAFVIRLYPIPEPSALVLLGSVAIGGLLRVHSCRRRSGTRELGRS